ncbi:MAG: hypothetical protein HY291_08755 [Planctomycetes bacterium]|nr:hypothetical protein [Planctomycetota bacterium]
MELVAPDLNEVEPRLLRGRDVAGLAVAVALQALLAFGAIDGPWPSWPSTLILNPTTLAAALAGMAVACALLFAPGWSSDLRVADADGRVRIERVAVGRALFVGCWQGAVLGYFLLLASRMEALDGAAILRCIAVVAGVAAAAVLAAARFPRVYPGLAFFTAVALPFFCYVAAEIHALTPSGSLGWTRAPGVASEHLRTLVDGILFLSPGTAVFGALRGQLITGSEMGWPGVGFFLVLYGALGAVLLLSAPRPVLRNPPEKAEN